MKDHIKPAITESIGTFLLTFVVLIGSYGLLGDVPTAVAAALTLGIFVYVAGGISGSHINPAVTIALASVGKIENARAFIYIVAQLLGAFIAMKIFSAFHTIEANMIPFSNGIMFFEAIGAFVFLFGLAAVANGKVEKAMSGVVIGGSLLLGIFVAMQAGAGVLNPAVALGISSLNIATALAPIAGGITGMWTFKLLTE